MGTSYDTVAVGVMKRDLMIVERETPDCSEVLAFLVSADQRSASLYPEEGRPGSSLSELLSTDVRFFVARQDSRALGCGGYALLQNGSAEMKRLFVDPAYRGQGVGNALVESIERDAAREGLSNLFLETGVKSTEALSLYHRHGFEVCPPFGNYTPDPLSIFMVKRLVQAISLTTL